jgi:hypothetical protein
MIREFFAIDCTDGAAIKYNFNFSPNLKYTLANTSCEELIKEYLNPIMKQQFRNIFLLCLCLISFNTIYAQGGGPPMLTDDPATLDKGTFEINTSINSQITKEVQLAVPYVDANYGVNNNLQLKVEMPNTITMYKQKHTSDSVGNPLFGVKYHFINEDKYFLSATIYPQVTITGSQKGFLLPLLLVKTIGKFIIGEEVGYLFVEKDSGSVINGNLLSYKASKKWEIMGEFFLQKSLHPTIATTGFMNYGCRYTFNKTFTFLGSIGTQVITPANQERQYFFSFIGIQTDF